MKSRLNLALWAVSSVFAVSPAVGGTPAYQLYENVTLVETKQQTLIPNAYLYVSEGRFLYVGTQRPALAPNTEVIDLNHQFVTPGFVDTHAHMPLGAVSMTIADEQVLLQAENSTEIAEWNAQQYLAYGITTIRNPGGDTAANISYREAQRSGAVAGPRAFVAGDIIDTTHFAGLSVPVDSEDSIVNEVERQAHLGVDFVKAYTGLDEAQVATLVREADRHALPVIGHLDGLSWRRGAELGIDHIVHAMPTSPALLAENVRQQYQAQLRPGTYSYFEWYAAADLAGPEIQTMITTLARTGTSVDPTLIVFYNAFYGDQASVLEHPQLTKVHPSLLKNWQTFFNFTIGWSADDFAMARQTWPKVLAFVKSLYDNGVLLTVGTDLGNPWVIPGVSYFQEMQLLADAGIPPFAVLTMATHNGAEVIGQSHQLGQLATGYVADFLVFGENPALSLDHLASLRWVVQDGEVRYHSAL